MEKKSEGAEENLFQKLKEYTEVQFSLFKLRGINKLAASMASIISIVVLIVIGGGILLCFTIGLSLLIGSWIGKIYAGFFIVGGIYLIAGLLLYLVRDKFIHRRVADKLIKELLN
ncbi:MAG TPA: hypothetical protein VG847_02715 [Chitinophagaceae bacterium]|nr:hypothetical protein [Chitinophagaceae bacterium]